MATSYLESIFALNGRTVVVTGGASGIGEGISAVLVPAGAHVVIADINLDAAEHLAASLRADRGTASAVRVDLASEESVINACRQVISEHGAPWALVNNAGLQNRQLLFDTTQQEWDLALDVNTRGPFLMIRELGRAMVEAGGGGRIVNIASAAVIGGITRGHAAYASSKSTLLGLTNAAALELAGHGITVNSVLPGGEITPGAMHATGPTPEGPALRMPPLGMSEPEDIGTAVLFLISSAANKISNQALAVEGGWTLA